MKKMTSYKIQKKRKRLLQFLGLCVIPNFRYSSKYRFRTNLQRPAQCMERPCNQLKLSFLSHWLFALQKHTFLHSHALLLIYKWSKIPKSVYQIFDLDVTYRNKPEVENALVSKWRMLLSWKVVNIFTFCISYTLWGKKLCWPALKFWISDHFDVTRKPSILSLRDLFYRLK